MVLLLVLYYNSVMDNISNLKRRRRSPDQIIENLSGNPAEVAVYLSARINSLRKEEERYFDLCPEHIKPLLLQLLKND